MARLRGASDALALRLRHHDDAVHASRMPTRREAKDVYDALEQVRVEVVGSRHMAGVAANLQSKLAEECEAEGYDRMTRKDQLPIQAALSLLAREQMSGEKIPAGRAAHPRHVARHAGRNRGRRAHRDEPRAGRSGAYARAARKLLAALDLAEAESDAEPEDNTDEGEEGGEQSGQQDEQQDGSGQSEAEQDSMIGANPEEMEGDAADDEGTESDEEAADRRGRRSSRRPAAAPRTPQPGQRGGLPCLHSSIRRGDRG